MTVTAALTFRRNTTTSTTRCADVPVPSEPVATPVAVVPVPDLITRSRPGGVPVATARTSPAALDVLRRRAVREQEPPRAAPAPSRGIDRLRRSTLLPVSRCRGTVIRRAPAPLGVDGEYVDPDIPGFVFIGTARENEFVIKGSTIGVIWDPVAKRWLDSKTGLVCSFQSSPGPRQLPKVRTLPELGSKNWQHFELSMAKFKQLGLLEQMNTIAELAGSFEVTPIELFWEQLPQEKPARFYRYHKFPLDPLHQTLVFGGGINKAEIDDELIKLNLKRLITDRFNLFKQVSKQSVVEQVKAMQKFQANAMTTPFIATTTDGNYARQLFKEYPPTSKQKAVILVIEGPQSHAFDFEARFHAIKEADGGKSGVELANHRRPREGCPAGRIRAAGPVYPSPRCQPFGIPHRRGDRARSAVRSPRRPGPRRSFACGTGELLGPGSTGGEGRSHGRYRGRGWCRQ